MGMDSTTSELSPRRAASDSCKSMNLSRTSALASSSVFMSSIWSPGGNELSCSKSSGGSILRRVACNTPSQ